MEIYGYGNIVLGVMDWFEAYGEALADCHQHGTDFQASIGAGVRDYTSPWTPESLLLISTEALTWSKFHATLKVIEVWLGLGSPVDFSYKITEDSSGEEIGSGYLRRKPRPRLDASNSTLSIFGSGTNATNLTELTWL